MKNIIALAFVLSCATAAVAQSYLTPGGSYPYPNQPANPPPYTGITCKLEYTGNYYYVSRNGARFTELTSSLQQALDQKQQLISQGMCSNSYQDSGKCDVEYTGNYYYVSREGARIGDLSPNVQAAINTRDMLYRSQECNYQTYQPTTQCSIDYTGNYYYVSRSGRRFTDLTTSLQQASNARDQLVRSYLCQAAYQYAPCRLEYTGNYYYLSINSRRASDLTPNLDMILRQQQDFVSRGMCSSPQATEQCRVNYTGNYYYVSRNGARISDLKQDYYLANQIMYSLQSSRNCY